MMVAMDNTNDERQIRLANEARASAGLKPFTDAQAVRYLKTYNRLLRGMQKDDDVERFTLGSMVGGGSLLGSYYEREV